LQQNKIMKVISKKLVRKSLELLKKLAKTSESEEEEDEETEGEDEEEKEEKKEEDTDFDKFYKEFGKNLKMGCYEDDSNRSKLAKLLRFFSTESTGKGISLDAYLDRMKESQESIYYMSGDSLDIMQKSPTLQVFSKKDLEVLLSTTTSTSPASRSSPISKAKSSSPSRRPTSSLTKQKRRRRISAN